MRLFFGALIFNSFGRNRESVTCLDSSFNQRYGIHCSIRLRASSFYFEGSRGGCIFNFGLSESITLLFFGAEESFDG
jgi:hypothetical protein